MVFGEVGHYLLHDFMQIFLQYKYKCMCVHMCVCVCVRLYVRVYCFCYLKFKSLTFTFLHHCFSLLHLKLIYLNYLEYRTGQILNKSAVKLSPEVVGYVRPQRPTVRREVRRKGEREVRREGEREG